MFRLRSGLIYGFYGGYEDAERVIAVFFPEGFMAGEDALEHFKNIPEESPLTVIRAELKKGTPPLSHRDYLGALMGLGIRREMTGDIIVRPDGADIIVMKEIAEFLLLHYMKAGRANLQLSEVSVQELIYSASNREESLEKMCIRDRYNNGASGSSGSNGSGSGSGSQPNGNGQSGGWSYGDLFGSIFGN